MSKDIAASNQLDLQELNTILHALRILQQMRKPLTGPNEGRGCADAEQHKDFFSNATACDHFSEAPPLDNAEIEALCERLYADKNHTPATPREVAYRKAAFRAYRKDDNINYREDAPVEIDVDEEGKESAWVQVWVHMFPEEAGLEPSN